MFEVINYRQHPNRLVNDYLAIVLRGEYPTTLAVTTWVVSLDKVNHGSSIEEVVMKATLLLAFDHLYPSAVSTLIHRITQQQFVSIAERSESHIFLATKQSFPELF